MKYIGYTLLVLLLALLLGWFAASQSGQVELAKSQAEQAKYLSQVQLAQTQADLERAELELQTNLEQSRLELQAELERTKAELERTRLELQADLDQARLEVRKAYIPVIILSLATITVLVAGFVIALLVFVSVGRQRRDIPQVTQLIIPGVLSEPTRPTRTGYILAEPTSKVLLNAPRKEEYNVHSR